GTRREDIHRCSRRPAVAARRSAVPGSSPSGGGAGSSRAPARAGAGTDTHVRAAAGSTECLAHGVAHFVAQLPAHAFSYVASRAVDPVTHRRAELAPEVLERLVRGASAGELRHETPFKPLHLGGAYAGLGGSFERLDHIGNRHTGR